MKKSLYILLASLALISVQGCAAPVATAAVAAGAGTVAAVGTDTRGAETVVDDQQLKSNVEDALKKEYPTASFVIASFNHKILLAGRVAKMSDVASAEKVVAKVGQVSGVWNYLTVSKHVTGKVIDTKEVINVTKDAAITTKVKAMLINQKSVNANNIKVVSADGVAYLLGADAGSSKAIDKVIKDLGRGKKGTKVVSLIGK